MGGARVRAAVTVGVAVLLANGGAATAMAAEGGRSAAVTCDVAAMSARAAQLRAQGREAEAQRLEQRVRACEDAERDSSGPIWR